MITPDTSATADKPAPAADAKPAGKHTEHCVPLAALAVDGTAPAAGDAVEYTVRGQLARSAGDHAYITPESINDEPATPPAAERELDEEGVAELARKADERGAPWE